MVKWLKRLGIASIALIAIVVGIGLTLPSGYSIERSTVIMATPGQVHALAGDFERWEEWTPWKETDPSLETTFGETTTGVGGSQSWDGESGSGAMRFTAWDAERGVEYEFSFDGVSFLSDGAIRYEPIDGGTRVTWEMRGDVGLNIIGRYFGRMMDTMVGPDFEKGLAKLKERAEATSSAASS